MRIGILGAGGMADALGTQWHRAGHEVMISGRDPERTVAQAARMTRAAQAREREVLTGTFAEAAAFGDVVMAAVLEAGLTDVLAAAGTALRGKPLIDVTNVHPDAYDPTRPIAGAAADLTGAHVVKAFNLCHVDVWRMTPPVFDGRPLAVPLCGDDPAALEPVRRLVTDLGCTPLDGGGLARATLLEATAAFVIGLWFAGADAQAILTPKEHAGV
ncbi:MULTISPECIES: NAD(P)-binding domain-containing protein [unclassified Nonomuraea]|uniref:NADPH-dependent F420 reductase n=1 Tax=unclassified Nonomuraea TaxID=2593643 RepID=UPI0033FDF886